MSKAGGASCYPVAMAHAESGSLGRGDGNSGRAEHGDGDGARAAIDAQRAVMEAALVAGGAGVAACAGLSDAYDRVVARQFAIAAGERPGWALIATGGWGRRELCP